MLKKLVLSLVLTGFTCNLALAADDFDTRKVRLGALRLDLPEKDVKSAIPCPVKVGKNERWEADGAYHQTWAYAACGVKLDMVSEKKAGPKVIYSIEISSPSTLSTDKGIQIGSTDKAVTTAYKRYLSKEESSTTQLVAGSVYDGLMFQLKNGKVESIFLGAAAE